MKTEQEIKNKIKDLHKEILKSESVNDVGIFIKQIFVLEWVLNTDES